MNNSYIFDKNALYEATNKGLDILLRYINNLPTGVENGKIPFAYRNEKTPSAYIKPSKDNTHFVVVDFGGENYSPVDVVMDKMGLEFGDAMKHLYNEFGLSLNGSAELYKPTLEYHTLTDDDRPADWYHIEEKDYENLDQVHSFLTIETAKKYNFVELSSYEFIFINKKNNQKTLCKISATPEFPIFGYKADTFVKIYQPKSSKSEYKHSSIGIKSKFVFGLDYVLSEIDNFDKNEDDDLKVIIASGGSDGLTLASMGYLVIWTNSEAEQISLQVYNKLQDKYKKVAEENLQIYNLPDTDKSGISYAYSLAETFWDIKTIYLPAIEMHANGKDFRDWLHFHKTKSIATIKYLFNNLIKTALRLNFIDYNSNGKPYIISTFMHYFLKVKGFAVYIIDRQLTDKNAESQFIFIQKIDNIVTQMFQEDIRKFCENYYYQKGSSISIIDLIKNTEQFSLKRLSAMDRTKVKTKNFTDKMQRFYFANNYVEITKDEILFSNYKNIDSEIWNYNIIDKKILKEKTPSFQVVYDEKTNTHRPQINVKNNEFLNYLINGSRVFWREELESEFINEDEKKKYLAEHKFSIAGPRLTQEQINTQEAHLLNKFYVIGYLMHRFKKMSLAKMVYIMDDAVKTDENESNGRSGKSLMIIGLEQLLFNNFYINGKSKTLASNAHLFDGFDKEKALIHVEDLDQYMGIEFFFNLIASKIPVNPKHGKAYIVGFEEASKMVTTSNFGIGNINQSILGRLMFVSFSNYYHLHTEHYNEKRQVSDDFGHDLFSVDWKEDQWNLFYNFLFECCQFYLQNTNNIFEAPQDNIHLTNSQAMIGNAFIDWADNYFYETQTIDSELIQGTLNNFVSRDELQTNYSKKVGDKFKKSSQNFKKSLKEYCKTKNYVFNPPELESYNTKINAYSRPIYDNNNKRQVVEHFYIRTKETQPLAEPLQTIDDTELHF